MRARSLFIWVFTLAFTFILLSLGTILVKDKVEAKVSKVPFQKGMCLVTWNTGAYDSKNCDKTIEKLASMGVDTVSIVPTWYQDDTYSFTIKPDPNKTPKDSGVIRAIKKCHSEGMKVMMKPQLDIKEAEGAWRGDISFPKDEQWERWFDSYNKFIMHYVDIAAKHGVEYFCVGTELTATALEKPDLWRSKVIAPIRGKYDGLITYAANWYKEYYQIEFWKDLDFAGIDAYFPIGDDDRLDIETLRKNWKDWTGHIKKWQKEINMPVCFPEAGYKSCTGTFIYPWEYLYGRSVDMEQQFIGVQALIDTFGNEPWFCGTYWWYWGTNVNMGGKNNRGFILNNKPAADLISDWYHGKYKPYQEGASSEKSETEASSKTEPRPTAVEDIIQTSEKVAQ